MRIDDLWRCLAVDFERLRLTLVDAEGLAGLLVDSELRGHSDHGVAALGVPARVHVLSVPDTPDIATSRPANAHG